MGNYQWLFSSMDRGTLSCFFHLFFSFFGCTCREFSVIFPDEFYIRVILGLLEYLSGFFGLLGLFGPREGFCYLLFCYVIVLLCWYSVMLRYVYWMCFAMHLYCHPLRSNIPANPAHPNNPNSLLSPNNPTIPIIPNKPRTSANPNAPNRAFGVRTSRVDYILQRTP